CNQAARFNHGEPQTILTPSRHSIKCSRGIYRKLRCAPEAERRRLFDTDAEIDAGFKVAGCCGKFIFNPRRKRLVALRSAPKFQPSFETPDRARVGGSAVVMLYDSSIACAEWFNPSSALPP